MPTQVQHVGAVLTGEWDRAGWWGPGRTADWADAIELARRIGRTAGAEIRVETAELAPLPPRSLRRHPGR